MSGSDRVPAALQERYHEVIALTDKCCQELLTQEYGDLCRKMAASLCRKRPSPLISGKASTWACGIVYSIGRVNFLFDKSQTPYLRADELCGHFGLSTSTGTAKSKAIMDILNVGLMDPVWTLPSRQADNPMAWLIMVNGTVVDARAMPKEIQEEAIRRGLIPSLPVDGS
ncbi:MAG: DUF6398 domain-containing protein [Nitrospirae bacterium]|nr:DUF6398 domain-containing protein [Nitrospirota bacterium]